MPFKVSTASGSASSVRLTQSLLFDFGRGVGRPANLRGHAEGMVVMRLHQPILSAT
jgi:hypothetical protein